MAIHLDHLSVVGVLTRTVRIYGSQWKLFAQLALATMLPLLVLLWIMEGVVAITFSEVWHTIITKGIQITGWDDFVELCEQMGEEILQRMDVVLVLTVVYLVLYTIITISGRGAMIRATAEMYANQSDHYLNHDNQQHQQLPWTKYFRRGLGNCTSLFVAGLFMIAGSVGNLWILPVLLISTGKLAWLGILLAIVAPALVFWLSIRLMLVYPIIVVEQSGAWSALQRSWELTRSGFCDIWCATIAPGIPYVIMLWLSTVIAATTTIPLLATSPFMGVVLTTCWIQIPSFLLGPVFLAINSTIVYLNRRIHAEGLTRDALLRDLALAPNNAFDHHTTTAASHHDANMTEPLLSLSGGAPEGDVEPVVHAEAEIIVEEASEEP